MGQRWYNDICDTLRNHEERGTTSVTRHRNPDEWDNVGTASTTRLRNLDPRGVPSTSVGDLQHWLFGAVTSAVRQRGEETDMNELTPRRR